MTTALHLSTCEPNQRSGRVERRSSPRVVAAVVGAAVSSDDGRTVQAVGELASGGEYHQLIPARIFDSRARISTSPRSARSRWTTSPTATCSTSRSSARAACRPSSTRTVTTPTTTCSPSSSPSPSSHRPDRVPARSAPGHRGRHLGGQLLPEHLRAQHCDLRPGDDGKISIRLSTRSTPARPTCRSTCRVGSRRVRRVRRPRDPGRAGPRVRLDGSGVRRRTRRGDVADHDPGAAPRRDDPGTVIVPDDPDVVGVLVNIAGVNWFAGSRLTYISAIPESWRPARCRTPATSTSSPVRSDRTCRLCRSAPMGRSVVQPRRQRAHDRRHRRLHARRPAGEPRRTGRAARLAVPGSTRLPEFFSQPLGPANAEDFSFENFVADVKIGSEPVGAQLGLLGNLAVTGVERQYPWAPVGTT